MNHDKLMRDTPRPGRSGAIRGEKPPDYTYRPEEDVSPDISDRPLSAEEKRLIRLCRDTAWGRVQINLKNGVPIMASEVKRDVKLT